MTWELLADMAALEKTAGRFLRTDPVAHTVVLGVMNQPSAAPAPDGSLQAVCRDQAGAVIGVAWCTPPYPVGITSVGADAAAALAPLLDLPDATMVVGPSESAQSLADALARRPTGTARIETLYRLDAAAQLTPDPRPRPAGITRLAVEADVPLLTTWVTAFHQEAQGQAPPDPEQRVRESLADGTRFVWDAWGIRAMVGGRTTGAGIARIGPVYTPPEARGAGIASACVEDVCRILFDRGAKTVTLYADDANPTSTGIYRRLGFRPVLAWSEYRL